MVWKFSGNPPLAVAGPLSRSTEGNGDLIAIPVFSKGRDKPPFFFCPERIQNIAAGPVVVYLETSETPLTERPLSLHDRDTISGRLDAIGLHLSEFSFPNLYLFRNSHRYSVIETPHGLFISGYTYDKKPYIMPMMRPSLSDPECFKELKELLALGPWEFAFPIPQEWLDCFEEDQFTRNYSEDDSDYLFQIEKMKTYPGKKMHKKKNLLNQFLRDYEPRFLPLGDDLTDRARAVLELWQDTSNQELETSDYRQCLEGLEMREALGLTGAMAFSGETPLGFILGEPLNKETFTIHFAKADISFRGVYQYLFNRFAAEFCPDFLYLNLEQDLGKEGLRKTKRSYRPDRMAHKYRVGLRKRVIR